MWEPQARESLPLWTKALGINPTQPQRFPQLLAIESQLTGARQAKQEGQDKGWCRASMCYHLTRVGSFDRPPWLST